MSALKNFIRSANANRPLLYFNTVLLFVLLNMLAYKSSCRLDLTRDGTNSLSESTVKVLSQVDEPILIEAYITQNIPGELLSMLGPVLSQLSEIERVGGKKVKLRIINPESEEDRKMAEERGIQGLNISEAKDVEASVRLGYFGIYLQIGEKTAVLNLVDDGRIIEDLEYRFLREIKKMTKKREKSGIGFVRAPGTLDLNQWRSAQDQSKDNLFGFHTLLQREEGETPEVNLADSVPADVDTLVIAGLPRLEEKEIYHLDQFIMRGRNIVLMLKSFDFQSEAANPQMAQMGLGGNGGGFAQVMTDDVKKLNDWLGKYGILLNGEILFEPELGIDAYDVEGRYARKVRNPAWAFFSRQTGNIESEAPVIRNTSQVVVPWFSGLDIREAAQGTDVKYTTLVQTTEGAVKRTSSSLGLKEIQDVGRSPTDERVPRPVPVAVLANGKFHSAFTLNTIPKNEDRAKFREIQPGDTKSNLLVIGSPYLVSDMLLKNEFNMQIYRVNYSFLVNALEAIGGDTDLLAARSRIRSIERLSQTSKLGETIFTWFHILALPLLLGIYGTVRLARRNQRRGLESSTGEKS